MRLLIILSVTLLSNALHAQQPDTSYQLLWYKGKKIRTNVLLTRTYDTVTWVPAKRQVKVVSKAGDGRQYDMMLADLKRTPARMDQAMKAIAANLPKTVVPYYAAHINKAYTRVHDDLIDILSNTIDIPALESLDGQPMPVASQNILAKAAPGQPAAATASKVRPDLDAIKSSAVVKKILEYYAKNKGGYEPDLPAPPENDYSYCSECDADKEKRFKKDLDEYRSTIAGEDKYILNQLMAVLQQTASYMDVPLLIEVDNLLSPVLEWLVARAEYRAVMLMEAHIHEPLRVRAVTIIAMETDRMRQKFGLPAQMSSLKAAFLRGQETLARYIAQAYNEYNYPVALNHTLVLSTYRQMELAGMPQAFNLWEKLNFNQFKMKVDISGKISGDGAYQVADLTSENWFSAMPDEQCKLQWIMLGPPMSKMEARITKAELRGNGGEITYAGTKDWESDMPLMRVDFCGNRKDSIEIYSFHARRQDEVWVYPNIGPMKTLHMNVVLTGCFVDVQRTMQKAAYYKTPGNVEKMKQQMEAQYKEFLKNGGADLAKNAAQMNPQDVQQMIQLANTLNAGNKIGEMVKSPSPVSYLVLPVVYNKTRLVLRERLNGKELFPGNKATEYAWFDITLEQDPKSPKKSLAWYMK